MLILKTNQNARHLECTKVCQSDIYSMPGILPEHGNKKRHYLPTLLKEKLPMLVDRVKGETSQTSCTLQDFSVHYQ
jgi:hypothetical protein